MAALPTSNSHISTHLSDRALTPLVSSSANPTTQSQSQSHTQAQALSSLTTTAITAYDTASRLGLGLPQRIMIETRSHGPVILHSFLNPQSSGARPLSQSTRSVDDGRGIVEQAREDLRPVSGSSGGEDCDADGDGAERLVNGMGYGDDGMGGESEVGAADENSVQQPPLLIATVVTEGAAEAGEGRRAAARLERVGREFQREWGREQEQRLGAVAGEDGG